MRTRIGLVVMVVLASPLAGGLAFGVSEDVQTLAAERFFRGVYACDAAVVRQLAAPEIVLTYPVFKDVLGTQAIRGADAVEAFAKRFCGKWADPEIVFHERLSDGKQVVLVWSFSARDAAADQDAPRSSWGGISLFRFNAEGQVTAEIGEESTPGPMSRFAEAVAQ